MHIIDLRSDTITHPTPAMRAAMAAAEVGDDVFGDDPTVIRLEAMAAARVGKEAGLFVASGTMGNLVSLLAQCGRGDEVIVGDQAHTYINEQGGMAALGGIHPRALRNQPDGTLDLDDIAAAVRDPGNMHYPRTRLITVENTHNRCGGVPLTVAYMNALGKLARDRGLRVHLDGARIFNAAVALGVDVKALTADADTLTFCLSKGLAAPVGSVVCGDRAFIAEARRARKVVGGGDAPGGRDRRGGHRGAGADGGPAGRGSRATRARSRPDWPRFPASGLTTFPCAPTSSTSRSRGRMWMRRAWWPGWRNPACGWGRWAGVAYAPC